VKEGSSRIERKQMGEDKKRWKPPKESIGEFHPRLLDHTQIIRFFIVKEFVYVETTKQSRQTVINMKRRRARGQARCARTFMLIPDLNSAESGDMGSLFFFDNEFLGVPGDRYPVYNTQMKIVVMAQYELPIYIASLACT
jgi:hypothetical protein